MSEFIKTLPEWNAAGTKPPQSKLDEGWLAEEKPPASAFNWLQYSTYQALQELQQDAIKNGGNVPNISSGLEANRPAAGNLDHFYIAVDTKTIYRDNGTEWENITASFQEDNKATQTLTEAINVITTDFAQSSLKPEFYGDEELNHTGWQGGFYEQGQWDSSLVIDTSTSKFGGSSGKIDNSAGTGGKYAYNGQKMYLGGKYILLGAWLKSNSGTPKAKIRAIAFDSSDIGVSSDYISKQVLIDSTWKFYYVKVDLTSSTASYWKPQLGVDTYGTTDDVVNFDGMVVYELTQSEFDYTHTKAEIERQFPYVDDIKPIRNVWMKSVGKNLIKPFNQWDNIHDNATVISPYELELDATDNFQNSYDDIDCVPNQSYTISGTINDDVNARLFLRTLDSDGNTISSFNTSTSDTVPFAITTESNAVKIRVEFDNGTTTGTFTLKQPQLEANTSATTFEEYQDSLQFFDEKFYKGDYPYISNQKHYKAMNKKEILLDGDLPWAFISDYTGYKRVKVTGLTDGVNLTEEVVKYDGSILTYVDGSWDSADKRQLKVNELELTIADADSGWWDSWTSSMFSSAGWSGIISALMNGWKYTGDEAYNSPSWVAINDSNITSTDFNVVKDNIATSDWKGYKLVHELAQTEHVDIDSKVIGECTLDEVSHVSYGVGMVYKERAYPVLKSGGSTYTINNTYSSYSDSLLDLRLEEVVGVYKNGEEFTNYSLSSKNSQHAYGKYYIDFTDYNGTDPIYVTYIAQQYQLSTSLNSVDVTYNKSMKTQVDQNTQAISKHETEIDDLRLTTAKKEQMDYVDLDLINAWSVVSGYQAGIQLNDFGELVFKGRITGGTSTNGTTIAYIPFDVVVGQPYFIACKNAEFLINTDKSISIYNYSGSYAHLDGIRIPVRRNN